MRVTFGDVSTDLPEGWIDGSIIKFSDPARPASEGAAQPSVVIMRADDAGDALPEILAAHADRLADTVIGFDVQGTGAVPGRHDEVHYLEHRFGEHGEFSQITMLTRIAGTVFIVTGTADTDDYPALRPRFLGSATSLTCA